MKSSRSSSNSLGSWVASTTKVELPLEQSVSNPSQVSAAPGLTAAAWAAVMLGSALLNSGNVPVVTSRQSSPATELRVLPTAAAISVHSMKPSESSSISSLSSGVPSLPGYASWLSQSVSHESHTGSALPAGFTSSE